MNMFESISVRSHYVDCIVILVLLLGENEDFARRAVLFLMEDREAFCELKVQKLATAPATAPDCCVGLTSPVFAPVFMPNVGFSVTLSKYKSGAVCKPAGPAILV